MSLPQSIGKGWIVLAAFKLVLLALTVSGRNIHLSWGETPLRAEGTTPPASEPEDPKRSFVKDLLQLPKLPVAESSKEEIGRFLTLAERAKSQVDERLNLLERRAKQLSSLESLISKKAKALDEERRLLAGTLQKEKDIAEDRLTILVELYGSMEPKKAGPIFEKMDKDLVVALFRKLKRKQITSILENMPAASSITLSEYFGRIGSAREYNLLKEMNASLAEAFEACKGLPTKEQASGGAQKTSESKK